MQTLNTSLVRTEEVAQGTKAFILKKPEGFSFIAGQYIRLSIPSMTESDPEGVTRQFSIATAPGDSELRITTRMRDTPFKRTLGSLKPGDALTFEGPMGSLVLPDDTSRPIVFLAGGIGITPFIGMARHSTKAFLMHDISLFYSNRTPEDSVFLSELSDLEKENPLFHLINTMTDLSEGAKWDGERGYIDAAMIKRHLADPDKSVYYIAGPPAMVNAMQKVLGDLHIPAEQIHTEEFTGY